MNEKGSVFVRDQELEQRIRTAHLVFQKEVRKVIVNERSLVELVFIALLAEAHIIVESPPGEGKSLLGRTVAHALSLHSRWYQFNAETTPVELLGYVDFGRRDEEGKPLIQFGPIFTNLLIADEINRAHSKVKSPLLAAMEERIATVPGDSEVRALPRPFIVIATQNPVESSSDVYNLGQAEVNRIDMKIKLRVQSVKNLTRIIPRNAKRNLERVVPVLSGDELLHMIEYVNDCASKTDHAGRSLGEHPIIDYIARLAHATHFVVGPEGSLEGTPEGASSRAATRLWKILNAYRIVRGVDTLFPEDVQALVPVVWGHRIIAKNSDEADHILRETLGGVPVIPTDLR